MFEHISALLSTPEQYSVLLVERAVVGLLRLCLLVAQVVCTGLMQAQLMANMLM